ncbi:G-type lectin S-receptor-like serine/threonine-protein kinase RKS1-like [Hibiscus syriacus]|uniref:G-type lectin S-receptor-like serine/threonine-protein kinase RKS1-like n=1 Tax=Hibiscus syriacus TaxID=106335 RepID=A0A6A2YTP9_HIBSY|nr:G-type lectin S-receptor-like serine/threonine-protein kinase RKS1-like [Hibiscus syriacus]
MSRRNDAVFNRAPNSDTRIFYVIILLERVGVALIVGSRGVVSAGGSFLLVFQRGSCDGNFDSLDAWELLSGAAWFSLHVCIGEFCFTAKPQPFKAAADRTPGKPKSQLNLSTGQHYNNVFPEIFVSKESNQSDSENEWHKLLKPFDLDELRKSFNKITPYQLSKLLELPIDVPTSLKLFQWAGSQKGYCHTFDVYYVIIEKLGAANEFKAIDRLLMQIKEEGVVFRESLFISIMKYYGIAGLPVIYNTLTHALSKRNRVIEAVKLLEEMFLMGCAPDVQTFNDVIYGLCKLDRIHEAAKVVDRMLLRGFTPDALSYGLLMQGLCKAGYVDEARALLHKVPNPNVVIFNTLINGYVASGRFEEAKTVMYDIMLSIDCKPDVFTFNILIHGLCKQGCLCSALDLVNEMERKGCKPNVITYSILIDGLCKEGRVEEVGNMLNGMSAEGVRLNTAVYNTLINALCKGGKIHEARDLFDEMSRKGSKPDIFTFNSLISGLCKVINGSNIGWGEIQEALKLVNEMLFRGCPLDEITCNGPIKALCRAGAIEKGLGLFEEMTRKGFVPSNISCNILIDGFCKARKVDNALEFLKEMIHRGLTPDLVTYNSLINGLCRTGRIREALSLFDKLEAEVIYPDAITYNTLISWHCKEGMFDEACLFIQRGVESGFIPNDVTWFILVNNCVRLKVERIGLQIGPANVHIPSIWINGLLLFRMALMV